MHELVEQTMVGYGWCIKPNPTTVEYTNTHEPDSMSDDKTPEGRACRHTNCKCAQLEYTVVGMHPTVNFQHFLALGVSAE